VARPAVLTWIYEELQEVFGDRQPTDWNYTADFPRLKRCLAVLHETWKLYTPEPIAKSTGIESQTLKVGKKSTVLPPTTLVIPNHVAIHTHPKYWGYDALEWRPSRWIRKEDTDTSKSGIGDESPIVPQSGSFIAWSEGVRVCPGEKFAQIEFVAAMAGILREWRVDPVPVRNRSETMEGARERVMKLVESDTGQVLLLQMLHHERAPLAWKKRA